ncbi:hypothetical protein SprV_0200900600 [Sparganum proliferum]
MISEEQMKHVLEAQQASFMALLTELNRNWGPASRENKRKQIEQRIAEFVYDPEGGVNFEAWFRKYEGLFEEEGAELDDKTKVEIMLLKLAQREHERRRFASTKLRTPEILEVNINEKPTTLQVDTASDLTIISMRTWEDIGSPELRPSEIIAWASNGTRMEFEGVFQATVSFRNMTCLADVYMSKTRNNLLGNKTITELGLWNRPFDEICSVVHSTTEEILKNKYMERVENAAGRCTKTKISLKVKPESKPVFMQSRRVPFAVQSSVEAELERLQAKGIIYPTNYSA